MPETTLPSELQVLLDDPYEDLDGSIQRLISLEKILFRLQDRRAIFVTAYLNMTRVLKSKLGSGFFQDDLWVEKYAVSFANLYRIALLNFERGNIEEVPKAWNISFETSISNRGYIVLDLLLGINSHINHDLPFALQEVSIDPDRGQRREDHVKVNVVLSEAIDPIQNRISKMYAPGLALPDMLGGPLDERISQFSFQKARECAWAHAICLSNALNDEERINIRRNINDQAATLARLMLSSVTLFSWFGEVMRYLEGRQPWTQLLEVSF